MVDRPNLAVLEGGAAEVFTDLSLSLLEELAAVWRVPYSIVVQHALSHALATVYDGLPVHLLAPSRPSEDLQDLQVRTSRLRDEQLQLAERLSPKRGPADV